jgi:hypothetical protein
MTEMGIAIEKLMLAVHVVELGTMVVRELARKNFDN